MVAVKTEESPSPAVQAAHQEDSAPAVVVLTEGEIETPDEEEAAAVLAAVAIYLADEQAALAMDGLHTPWQWQASKVLVHQGFAPQRPPSRPHWGKAERLRQGKSGLGGIVGI